MDTRADTMTKVADHEVRENQHDEKKKEPRDRSGRTAAEKLLQDGGGWVGNDLEEVIEVVSATRSRSRF